MEKGEHSLLIANTGAGKTTFALNIAKYNKFTVLLSPTRVVVDQFIENAKQMNLKLVKSQSMVDDWAFGEWEMETGKIWVGTFAALKYGNPNWESVDAVIIDELHFLLDMSLFAESTALEVWGLITNFEKFPNTKFISMTASEELVVPFKDIFDFNKIIYIKTTSWLCQPENFYIYPSMAGKSNIEYLLHYCKYYVRNNEKILAIMKNYKELNELRELIKQLPSEVEIVNAEQKKTSESYLEIIISQTLPKKIRMLVATTWISLGASIYDEDLKHLICTFPNISIVHQSLSRVRSGGVNVAIMQSPISTFHKEQLIGRDQQAEYETLLKNLLQAKKEPNPFSTLYTTYKGEQIFFPLKAISEYHKTNQQILFYQLDKLEEYVNVNLNCNSTILWKELLQFTDMELNKQQIEQLYKIAQSANFPVNTLKQFEKTLRLKG